MGMRTARLSIVRDHRESKGNRASRVRPGQLGLRVKPDPQDLRVKPDPQDLRAKPDPQGLRVKPDPQDLRDRQGRLVHGRRRHYHVGLLTLPLNPQPIAQMQIIFVHAHIHALLDKLRYLVFAVA